MPCSGLSQKPPPQLVSFEEVLENTVRLSGVSQERFQEVDNQPLSKLHVRVGVSPGDESVVVAAMGAKWNSSTPMIQARLDRAQILFDPSNGYGKNATFSGQAAGSVILVCRGQCSLVDKAMNAAAAGALAVIVQNSEPGFPEAAMSAGDSEPSIPGFMITQEAGDQLRAAVAEGRSLEIQAADVCPSTFFERLGGERPIRILVSMFYRRAFTDSESWFREIFAERDEATAVQNLADFLIQRWGGPTLYSERRGPAQLVSRHMGFDMKAGSAERWLHHMEASIAKMRSWDVETVELLKDYFRYQAHFLAYSYAAAYPEASGLTRDDEAVGCIGGNLSKRDDAAGIEREPAGCCGGGCNKQDVATSLANPNVHAHLETQSSACIHLMAGLSWFHQKLSGLHQVHAAILPGMALACLGVGFHLMTLIRGKQPPL
eukprot:TRINITY_DN66048_c0_g1_i1.p1 TRINITY_DN66048_c0_g1~~TRINITY_DN66048_c0_g1_i1.p1  ORF type:complete len:432 (+),score=73.45 TRINITY_DN66048_c0_g1_i1:19-1314(+)